MRVYLLEEGWGDNYWPNGIFSTAEKAMAVFPNVQWERVEYEGEDVWEVPGASTPKRITGHTIDVVRYGPEATL